MAEYDDVALAMQAAGMLAGQLNTVSANIENEDLLKDNYKWNEKMWQKQVDYNWEMWNATNQYNSPVATVQRLIDAGINPALALEKQGATTAANGLSSPSPGSPGTPSIQAYDAAPGMARASDILLSREARELQVERAFLENQDLRSQVYSNREMRALQNDILRTTYLTGQEEYAYQRDSRNDRVRLSHAELLGKEGFIEYQNAQIAIANTEQKLKEFELLNAPALFRANIGEISARTYAAIQSGTASASQAVLNSAQALVAQAQEFGIKLSNQQAQALLWSNIETIRSRNTLELYHNTRGTEYYIDTSDKFHRKMRQVKNRTSVLTPSWLGPQDPTPLFNVMPGLR